MVKAPGTEEKVAKTLARWKKYTDFASIRDVNELVKLPEDKRKEWLSLWADVGALLKTTGS